MGDVEKQISEAIAILEKGGVIVFPTETSYGIGCDATNEQAVERVYAIKGRPEGKGFPLIVPSRVYADKVVHLFGKAKELADSYWPGPLTIVAEPTKNTPVSARCVEQGMQAVRVSSHPVASELAERLGKPLVATSANLAGEPAMYTVENRFAGQVDQPDYFLDAGELEKTPASTIVKVDGDDIQVLREGPIKL